MIELYSERMLQKPRSILQQKKALTPLPASGLLFLSVLPEPYGRWPSIITPITIVIAPTPEGAGDVFEIAIDMTGLGANDFYDWLSSPSLTVDARLGNRFGRLIEFI